MKNPREKIAAIKKELSKLEGFRSKFGAENSVRIETYYQQIILKLSPL